MITCHLCPAEDNQVPDLEILDHIRVFHPEHHAELRRWPDGEPVVEDHTLEPSDFEAGS